MPKLNSYELRQIIDIVSKGINSVLMHSKEIPDKKTLNLLAENLTGIYTAMLRDLKSNSDEPEIKL